MSTWGIIVVKSYLFVRFLEEINDPKKHFEINWPLVCKEMLLQQWSQLIASAAAVQVSAFQRLISVTGQHRTETFFFAFWRTIARVIFDLGGT